LVELAVDEFIINWHLSNVDEERQIVESIVRSIKKKCHKLVFDRAYLGKFAEKLSLIEEARKRDTYVLWVLVKRLRALIHDSSKVRICEGRHVIELELIEDQFDRLVAKSALCAEGKEKLLVTTDSDLIGKAKALEKYGVKVLTPHQAEGLLLTS